MNTFYSLPDSTTEVEVPAGLIDQIVGQDRAVEVVRLAARQRRFLLIVGAPGTGKSLLGQSVAELLPTENLEDIVARPNREDPTLPLIERLPAGEGEKIIIQARRNRRRSMLSELYIIWVAILASLCIGLYYSFREENFYYLLGGGVVILLLLFIRKSLLSGRGGGIPKLLVNNKERKSVPFIDATGCQAGALLGDVRHDPYQSGGSETPPHELLEPGAIHRAHRGVLFIDEVSTLSMESQQSLLTAIQEKRLPILGRSPGSSGTMVRSEPAPCDFLLILAGNVEDIEKMHPALRSRIRGYGYEIFTNSIMEDNEKNGKYLVQFIAQEVQRDGKIPQFSRSGMEAILEEARVRAGNGQCFSTRFRELGGLVRIAGDLAVLESASLVEADHVKRAKTYALSLEEQRNRNNISGPVE